MFWMPWLQVMEMSYDQERKAKQVARTRLNRMTKPRKKPPKYEVVATYSDPYEAQDAVNDINTATGENIARVRQSKLENAWIVEQRID